MTTARSDALIIDAVRSPVGKYRGQLRSVRPDDLSAIVIDALVRRTDAPPDRIGDVLWGCANQAGEDNRNIGRISALLAGLPDSVPGVTINRLCGSSLDAVNQAARAIWSGDAGLLIAGGVESMSRAPYSLPKATDGAFGNITAYDTALGWRYPNPLMSRRFPLESMGETAENIAERYSLPRELQDEFALASHRKAVLAQDAGRFSAELIPVPLTTSPPPIVSSDEGPRRDTSLEKLAQLSPVFRINGTVTAGNSSGMNDGASAILISGESFVRETSATPLARIVATGLAGVDPRFMGLGPVPATRQALQKAGLKIQDIGLIELNEAFAAQALAVIRDLDLDSSLVNVNGGAIALGHPLGCSGARILTTLVHEMIRRKTRYGIATMCIGVGQGIATIVENLRI
jgi:3-oxoadipyl-CoA thiolase